LSGFTFIYIFSGVICAWALLRCLANENERSTRDMENRVRNDDREKAEKDILNVLAAANAAGKGQNGQRRG
jgi:hypothetical protein